MQRDRAVAARRLLDRRGRKLPGEPSARNGHARFEAAGAGDGVLGLPRQPSTLPSASACPRTSTTPRCRVFAPRFSSCLRSCAAPTTVPAWRCPPAVPGRLLGTTPCIESTHSSRESTAFHAGFRFKIAHYRRVLLAGLAGGAATNLAMLATFRLLGFGSGLLLDPRWQSPKRLALRAAGRELASWPLAPDMAARRARVRAVLWFLRVLHPLQPLLGAAPPCDRRAWLLGGHSCRRGLGDRGRSRAPKDLACDTLRW